MALVREFIARLFVALAVVALAVALGTWWASLLSIRTAGTLDGIARLSLTQEISSQLDHLQPGAANLPGAESDITQALANPEITQALAQSGPSGSKVLTAELAKSDSSISTVLSGKFLSVSAGEHYLARTADHLRAIAKTALIVALVSMAAALVLSPLRRVVLRHLAYAVVAIGGLVLLASVAVPAAVGRMTHGGVHRWAESVLSGGNVVRTVVVEVFIGGIAVLVATLLFELLPAKRVKYDAAAGPIAPGRSV